MFETAVCLVIFFVVFQTAIHHTIFPSPAWNFQRYFHLYFTKIPFMHKFSITLIPIFHINFISSFDLVSCYEAKYHLAEGNCWAFATRNITLPPPPTSLSYSQSLTVFHQGQFIYCNLQPPFLSEFSFSTSSISLAPRRYLPFPLADCSPFNSKSLLHFTSSCLMGR